MCHTCHACRRGLLAHVPTCHKRDNHSTWRANVPKGVPIFQLFFRRIFQFTNFSIMPDICKFQEYLGNSRKFILREKKDLNLSIRKILLRKNLVSLEFLTSPSTGHVGLTGELFGQCKTELNIFFLPSFSRRA